MRVPQATPHRLALRIFIILLVVGTAAIAFVFFFSASYQGKFFPGTQVGYLDLGGMTYGSARQQLEEVTNAIIDEGITFSYRGEEFPVTSTVEDTANPELSFRLLSFDVDATIEQIAGIQAGWNEAEKVYYSVAGWAVPPVVDVDTDRLAETLRHELAKYEQPAVDASLVIEEGDHISITPEQGGQAFDYEAIVQSAVANLGSLANRTVTVQLEPDFPRITQSAAASAMNLVQQTLDAAPFVVAYEDYRWAITEEQVRIWLEFAYADSAVTVELDRDELETFLGPIAAEIDIETREAKFAMENGKVLEFQPSRNGRELLIEDSIARINEKIRQVGIGDIDLMVEVTEPVVTTEHVNNFGIRELIGEGQSNFSGSPKNRRHNITVGAGALNGILIEPGKEFSLVGALGKIEASTGYLPELVIKGNKTVPEYGGGLCQIGTTAFRAALDAGFPITERTNHSYRVSYYEPAGTDATIYDPKPDFKFINDTEHYVLFTTEIDGNDLTFRFYGTADGRAVEQTQPSIFNLVRPGDTKLVETTDLAPGEKKCTERAHTGADAEFTRTITYVTGEQKVETFRSHYKPWQEVCLVGVEELSGAAE
ncbi:MAG: VanW family protein [Patescibacteria group bacterium]